MDFIEAEWQTDEQTDSLVKSLFGLPADQVKSKSTLKKKLTKKHGNNESVSTKLEIRSVQNEEPKRDISKKKTKVLKTKQKLNKLTTTDKCTTVFESRVKGNDGQSKSAKKSKQRNKHQEIVDNRHKSEDTHDVLCKVISPKLSKLNKTQNSEINKTQNSKNKITQNSENNMLSKKNKLNKPKKQELSHESIIKERNNNTTSEKKKRKRKLRHESSENKSTDGDCDILDNMVAMVSQKLSKTKKTSKQQAARHMPCNKKIKLSDLDNAIDEPAFESVTNSKRDEGINRHQKTNKPNNDFRTTTHKSVTNTQSQKKLPFNINKLREQLDKSDHEKTNKTYSSKSTNEANVVDAKHEKLKVDSGKGTPCSLREKLQSQLQSARFRYLNEQLYTQSGACSQKLFDEDRPAFNVYHEGYQKQVSKWPANPLDIIIKDIESCKSSRLVIADFGCGEALLAKRLDGATVHSFDLVSLNERVTACDMSKVPLGNESVDVAVFCLSLMGTNLEDYLCEANRVLKNNGSLKIAEVASRFEKVSKFVRGVESMGFNFVSKNIKNKMFTLLNFTKDAEANEDIDYEVSLKPCLYKKR